MAMFIAIGEIAYPINTDAEREAAAEAMRDAGETAAQIFYGDPDDPSAYASVKWFKSTNEIHSERH